MPFNRLANLVANMPSWIEPGSHDTLFVSWAFIRGTDSGKSTEPS